MNEIKTSRFKSFLKSFTLYQKIFLAAVVILTAVFVIFFPEHMLEEASYNPTKIESDNYGM